MLLLVLCLVLVQGTVQHPQNEGVPSHHGGITPTEYQTSFSCVGRVAGYYADIESGCQLYHLCDVDSRRFTHSCPNATLFQQRMMICDHWYMVDCNKSVHDYSANLLIGQRDKPFVGNDHIHHREPVSHSPGSLQFPYWNPTVDKRPEHVPEDNDNIVHSSPPQQVSSIHFTYTPPPDIRSSESSQREITYRDVNTDYDSSGRSLSQISTARAEEQRDVAPVPRISQYHETGSVSSHREARYRDLTVDRDNTRQSVPRTFIPRFEDQRIITSTPLPSFSQYHEAGSERRLPDAYTNNPFFQSLINKPTPPSGKQINPPNPQQDVSKISSQQLPAKLEDIANVKVSQFHTPSTQRKVEEFSIHFDNHSIQNIPPSAGDRKFLNSYSDDPYFQPVTKTRTQEVPAIITARSFDPISPDIGENEEDLNNIVELHILDPRQMFYIPESNNHEIGKRNSTVLFISVPAPLHNNSHGFMHFRNDMRSLQGTNPQCPRCHPAFLSPGKCQPCVIIR